MQKINVRFAIPLFALFIFGLFFIFPSCNVQEKVLPEDVGPDVTSGARYHVPANWDHTLTLYVTGDQALTVEEMVQTAYSKLPANEPLPAIGLVYLADGILMSQITGFKSEFQALYGEVQSVGVYPAKEGNLLALLDEINLSPDKAFTSPDGKLIDVPVLVDCEEKCSKVTNQAVTLTMVGGVVFVGNCPQSAKNALAVLAVSDCTTGKINRYNIACPENCPCNYNANHVVTFNVNCLAANQVRQWTIGACTATVVGPLSFSVTVAYKTGTCEKK
ncbi:MAG TPA: hypothetical protein ENJ82_03370 [Bacteroidetes bacterium]|nr:hypothetical protein [Bacteroidota bacterium]